MKDTLTATHTNTLTSTIATGNDTERVTAWLINLFNQYEYFLEPKAIKPIRSSVLFNWYREDFTPPLMSRDRFEEILSDIITMRVMAGLSV